MEWRRKRIPDVRHPGGVAAEKNSGCEISGWNGGRDRWEGKSEEKKEEKRKEKRERERLCEGERDILRERLWREEILEKLYRE